MTTLWLLLIIAGIGSVMAALLLYARARAAAMKTPAGRDEDPDRG